MSTTAETRARLRRPAGRIETAIPVAADLTPRSAREAVGRPTGFERAAVTRSRAPLWQAAGIVGMIALIAAAALPLIANLLAIPL